MQMWYCDGVEVFCSVVWLPASVRGWSWGVWYRGEEWEECRREERVRASVSMARKTANIRNP